MNARITQCTIYQWICDKYTNTRLQDETLEGLIGKINFHMANHNEYEPSKSSPEDKSDKRLRRLLNAACNYQHAVDHPGPYSTAGVAQAQKETRYKLELAALAWGRNENHD